MNTALPGKGSRTRTASVQLADVEVKVAVQSIGGEVHTADDSGTARVRGIRNDAESGVSFVELETAERIVEVAVFEEEGRLLANVDGLTVPLEAWPERLPELLNIWQLRNRSNQGAVEMVAPLTGVVREIVVKEGDEVKEGGGCIVIEAMKMENMLPSPMDGEVHKVLVEPGQSVRPGTPLIAIEPNAPEEDLSGFDEMAPELPGGRLLNAIQRLDVLLDPGTFRELDSGVRHRVSDFGLEDREIPGDGVICGYGKIEGRTVYIYSQDFRQLGGSLGEMHARKICKIADLARQSGFPLIGIHDSGGARIQEGVLSLGGYGEIFRRIVNASGTIPQIACILGPSAGGAVYSPALMDFVVMTESASTMFLTGPRVVKTVTFEEVTADDLGGGRVHAEITGVAHFLAKHEADALKTVRRLVSYLPSRADQDAPRGPTIDPAIRSTPTLLSVVPEDTAQPYDVRDVIREVVDCGSFFEVHGRFAPNICVGFGRMEGQVVGVVANQPKNLAGCLDSNASRKGARFIRMCDAFRIPIVSLVDVPGFLPGQEEEHNGVIAHGAKLLYAYCESTVPKISVILRKAYGGAYIVMSSKHVGGDMNFSWPEAKIAVMGAKGAVEILHRRDVAEHGADSPTVQKHVETYELQFETPAIACAHGFIDRVIEPEDTRSAICEALKAMGALKKDLPDRVHGNMPT